MPTRTNLEQVAKVAGRAFLRGAASARGVSTHAVVSGVLNGMELGDDDAERFHSELLYAMALTIPPELARGHTLDYWVEIERWGAEVEDELRALPSLDAR